jgi:predicted nuclease of predicted toxin-antitoxin system
VSDSIRFHMDENVNSAIAKALRLQGIDVTLTAEEGILGTSDEFQVAFAQQQQRVIFTHDADLLRIASKGAEHSGIVYCAKDVRSLGEIIRGLVLIHQILTPQEMQGHVEYL